MLMKDARGQEIGWNAVVIFTYGSELRFGILRDVYGMECGDVVAYNGSGQETAIRCTSNQLMRIRDAQIPTDQIDSVMALRRRLLGKE